MKHFAQESIWVTGLTVRIEEKTILSNNSFTIGEGEFVGIIGPNGAGKSTLMRSLRGMVPLQSGEVKIYGRSLAGMGDKETARLIAYMQQDVNMGFGFTAKEIVLAGRYPHLKWWQNEREEDHRIAEKYMAFTGVNALAERQMNQVSGGERQRILLAKVLAQETPLIFLDEPTASLDLVYQEEIFRYCQTVCREGKTALLIAHDIEMAAKFCTRLILLANGKIIADGRPAEVITVKHLQSAYGLHAAVYNNPVTGNLDIHTFEAATANHASKKVHVIGGGGAARGIIRTLYEEGYQLSGGVFHEGDADADAAAAFVVDSVTARPFAVISDSLAQQNRERIVAADVTVLGNLYYGEQNLDNLQAAFTAKELIIIEDGPIGERDLTGGKATELYLCLQRQPQVRVMTELQFKARFGKG